MRTLDTSKALFRQGSIHAVRGGALVALACAACSFGDDSSLGERRGGTEPSESASGGSLPEGPASNPDAPAQPGAESASSGGAPGSAPSSTTWSHEPAGSTPFFDCGFEDTLCGLGNRYNTQAFAAPGGAGTQVSPSKALDEFLLTGGHNGSGQWGLDFASHKDIYVGMVWSTTVAGIPNNNNKLIFIRGLNNSFLVMQGAPGQAKTLKWYQQDEVDNCHIAGYGPFCWNRDHDGTGWFPANIDANAAVVSPGDGWHRVEMYLHASTTDSSKDGIIRVYVDGKLSTSHPNVNQAVGGFSNVEITSAWDGSVTATSDWHHYFDHLHVSFPVCPPSGC